MSILLSDLDNMAIGATLLGSGGGGDPRYDLLLAKQFIGEYGPVLLLAPDQLQREDFVVPCAFIGPPLVSTELVCSGDEFSFLLKEVEKMYGKKPTALVSAEIGGSNGLVGIWAAAKAGLPLVDGDLIGRAFPQLEMNSTTLFDVPLSYSFIADGNGNIASCKVASPYILEQIFRSVCQEFGSNSAVCCFLLDGTTAKKCLIGGSISRAINLGKALSQHSEALNYVGSGCVTSICQKIEGGFLRGSIVIAGERQFCIEFQNEFLALFEMRGEEKIPLVLTPDIIALVEEETGAPLSVEGVRFGMKVKIAKIEAPAIWKSPEGLALVGPKVFGYKEIMI